MRGDSKMLLSCTFAPDALEAPLRAWADKVLGLRGPSSPALTWVPYGRATAALGPSAITGVRALVVRSRPAIKHPETVHRVLTSVSDGGESVPVSTSAPVVSEGCYGLPQTCLSMV